jgi:ribosome assembly protein 1
MNRDFDDSVETGFQIATFQGPLCAEPVQGMAYFVESIQMSGDRLENEMRELVHHLLSLREIDVCIC